MNGSSETHPLIRLESLSKSYITGRNRVVALNQINLDVAPGEFIAVLGPSGCGKSTLLSIISLLERYDSGKYELAGSDTTSLTFDQRSFLRNRNLGLIFQAFNLIADMTVEENVKLPLRYSKIEPAEQDERVSALLKRVGLSDRSKHYPNELSGGQQQRVAIARAMVTGPALIVADEPTGNLDSHHAAEVMELIREFNGEGATVLLVTHDEAMAKFASRRVRMLDGRIVGGA